MRRGDTPPYLTEQIIAYLGNKRRLLPLIGSAMESVAGGDLRDLRFLDLFNGAGAVSRYARFRGMRVTANDWEPFTRILNRAWLEPRPGDLERLFPENPGYRGILRSFQSLPAPRDQDTYLARYYAPASKDNRDADYRTERLFYTRANALTLDAARNEVERSWPHREGDADADLRRCLLLAPLIYAAATHVNTSGVFKAYHKGFGGHGGDALGRILRPVTFHPPVVVDEPPGKVLSGDANALLTGGALDPTDIAYVDPPYNQHQYGSNYHLLNTMVIWDKIPEPLTLGADGTLLRKAAIRPDWKKTRSDYAVKGKAAAAFSELIAGLDAEAILVSYSTDGIIPFDELRRIVEKRGRVTLMANPYVKYRGGRQGLHRRDRNVEFVLVVEPGKRTRSSDRSRVNRILLNRRLQILYREMYRPRALSGSGRVDGDEIILDFDHRSIVVDTLCHLFLRNPPDPEDLSDREARLFADFLEGARCRGRDEEIGVLVETWKNRPTESESLVREIPRVLRKLAHRKYRKIFLSHLADIRALGAADPDRYNLISDAVDALEELAFRRFSG